MDYHHQNKKIGTLKDNIFRKKVQLSKHLMKKYNAWGVQLDTLTAIRDKGCTEIRILDTENNKIYSVSMEDMWGNSVVENYGDGQQAFLARDYWTTNPLQ